MEMRMLSNKFHFQDESARREFQSKLAAVAADLRSSQEQLAKAAVAKLEKPEDYDALMRTAFNEHLDLIGKLPDVPKTDKRSMAVCGRTCAGKTTLLNTLCGIKLSTSPVRNTKGATKVHTDDNLEVYDVFGVNDVETMQTMETLMLTKSLHVVVVVYSGSVMDII